ncbi:protein phosphatase 2C domain-containing protein [Cylindrospermum sp. FACHB-282]|uniref:protein phosphatase 2C domain-containing protein n=1 Tax=Cylindrospermum sp. FACHB-282 TaxID=2692794 RepID=UPI0016892D58|nr:protein phosphatase 2C domain-containing protein [Cylindrospermum sp. FACHB-282]MBD2383995.1 protein phosphatase 2C domain-containing protein [Cylindrospermum sp. FACHB-282]
MISTQRIIYCLNPDCNHPINPIGDVYDGLNLHLCASCQTPLVYRYLWASSPISAKILPGTKIADRYEVITQQIWLDTQPGLPPEIPEVLPPEVTPYLKLYQERLHLPQAYGFVSSASENTGDILLLENAPIDQQGYIYPTISDAWERATAVRQVYWLWQIIQLWKPLSELGVAQSLLIPDNLRVQGWCVRLLELCQTSAANKSSLADLGQSWQSWVASANTTVAQELQQIVQQMSQAEVELGAIATQLNGLLLSSVAELPLTLKAAGATDTGPELMHNEDACYPASSDLDDPLLSRLSIVCDGIGGHEGGEVASQLAVQSVKLQMRALLAEVAEQTELVPPDLLPQQIEASLRVVNNVIWTCNNEQNRQGRERMATTLVMAVQVPQRVPTTAGWQSENAHELYLANIGDSRAYWITRSYCQLLTVDDDVATREVRLNRSLYRQAIQRPDANSLTQALGIKEAESLHFAIQRLILEEDGILLLCSDGLSDKNWVEQSWQDYAVPLLTGKLTVEDAARNWINLANEKNGHDNTSVVLTLCRVSSEHLVPVTQSQLSIEIQAEELEIELVTESDLAESSQALLDLDFTEEEEEEEEATPSPVKKPILGKSLVLLGGLLVLLVGGTSLGLFAWWQFKPQSFQQMCRQHPQILQPLCSRRD